MTRQRGVKFNIFETVECAREFPSGDLHEVSCNLCGSSRGRTLFSEGPFDIRVCESCSLMYVSPQPTPETLDSYYETFYTGTSDQVADTWTHTASFSQMRKMIDIYGPRDGKLIDIADVP